MEGETQRRFEQAEAWVADDEKRRQQASAQAREIGTDLQPRFTPSLGYWCASFQRRRREKQRRAKAQAQALEAQALEAQALEAQALELKAQETKAHARALKLKSREAKAQARALEVKAQQAKAQARALEVKAQARIKESLPVKEHLKVGGAAEYQSSHKERKRKREDTPKERCKRITLHHTSNHDGSLEDYYLRTLKSRTMSETHLDDVEFSRKRLREAHARLLKKYPEIANLRNLHRM